jgi:hypothetical protein
VNKSDIWALRPTMVVIAGMSASVAFAQTTTTAPQAASPYTLAVFAQAPSGLSAPDSIAVVHDHVFVGYGDGHAPDGSDGLNSQVVEFSSDGKVLHTYTVKGHSDGLKVDPITHKLWALQNEDASPNLVIIDPETQRQSSPYTFSATPHGGGYDDIVFRGCKVFISASNPASNPNTGPAIVSAHLQNGIVEVESVLAGNATAIDIPTDSSIELNLQDPDSMTLDPLGNLVLDSQADQELIVVSHPGEKEQRAVRLPLSYRSGTGTVPVEVDDTAFATSTQGYILFADKTLNTVYTLKKQAFSPGVAYTAADGGPFVGTVDLSTGVITPIVTGIKGPGGLVFVDTSRHDFDQHGFRGDDAQCRDRDGERE